MAENLKLIGRCKFCRHWPSDKEIKTQRTYRTHLEFVDCGRQILAPASGKWGCWNWIAPKMPRKKRENLQKIKMGKIYKQGDFTRLHKEKPTTEPYGA